MAILKNVEIWYPKLDPDNPSKKHSKERPGWNVQIRTTDKKQRDEWKEVGLYVKSEVPDDGVPYWYVNIYRKAVKADGSPAVCPEVINLRGELVDPNSIGNGSIANIRIYQYKVTNDEGESRLVSILMKLQLVLHKLYVPKEREPLEDFEILDKDTEVIIPEETNFEDDDDVPF